MVQDLLILLRRRCFDRAVKLGHLSEEMINEYDPALMFTIPRLAIVCGLLVHSEGPLNPDNGALGVSEMFRPFLTLLLKIRELLCTLTEEELYTLERGLCSTEEPFFLTSETVGSSCQTDFQQDKMVEGSIGSSEISFHDALENIFTPGDRNPGMSETATVHNEQTLENPTTSCIIERPTNLEKQVDSLEDSLTSVSSVSSMKKCDSNDSGLHSENISNSESLYTVSSSDSHQTLNTAELTPLSEGEAIPFVFVEGREVTTLDCDIIMNEIFNEIVTEESGSVCSDFLNEMFQNVCSICQGNEQCVSCVDDSCEICSQSDMSSVPTVKLADSVSMTDQDDSASQSGESIEVENLSEKAQESNENEKSNSQNDPVVVSGRASRTRSNSKRKTQGEHVSSPFDKLTTKMDGSETPCQDCLEVTRLHRLHRLRYAESWNSNCSTCRSRASSSEFDCDKESCGSSDTSSYTSECNDDEEIALAVQAAENASRNEARSRFRSSSDMIHRLFVCISGVADQLQTNFASDLRNILRAVFDMNCSEPLMSFETTGKSEVILHPGTSTSQSETSINRRTSGNVRRESRRRRRRVQEPPKWMPDDLSVHCMACKIPFTFVRRRHHCRNCGKIFCGRCSANSVPLPHFGQHKPVRVCNRCYMFQVTPFTVQQTI